MKSKTIKTNGTVEENIELLNAAFKDWLRGQCREV